MIFPSILYTSFNFNPLPSCEGRPALPGGEHVVNFISTHSPHARGDRLPSSRMSSPVISTHSPHARGDVDFFCRFARARFISTHSPHARGDKPDNRQILATAYFNPLPSCEGRQHKPPKIHPDLRQLTQQNHDTPLFGALQAPFCGAEPDIRGAKRLGKP